MGPHDSGYRWLAFCKRGVPYDRKEFDFEVLTDVSGGRPSLGEGCERPGDRSAGRGFQPSGDSRS